MVLLKLTVANKFVVTVARIAIDIDKLSSELLSQLNYFVDRIFLRFSGNAKMIRDSHSNSTIH